MTLTLPLMQDHGVARSSGIEVKNPSDNASKRLDAQAMDERVRLDDEDDEVNMLFSLSGAPALPATSAAACVSSQGPGSGGQSTSATAKEHARGKAKAKARTERPAVLASKLRQQTTRLWSQMQSDVKEASKAGDSMLQECLQVHGSESQAAAQDPAYEIVARRLNCLLRLQDPKRQKPTSATGSELLQALNEDSFFEEQQWRPEAVQTLGQMNHVRATLLELQRTADAVTDLGNHHKDALEVVKTVARSITTEVNSWRANVAALKKARDLEQKQLIKEQERLQKLQEKKAKKEADAAKQAEAKRRRAAEAEAAKASALEAEAQAAVGDEKDERNPKDKRRSRKASAASELSESDPAILKALGQGPWADGHRMRYLENVAGLAEFIVRTAGMMPAVARNRRSAFKKVIEAAWLGFAFMFAEKLGVVSVCLSSLRLARVFKTTRSKPFPNW